MIQNAFLFLLLTALAWPFHGCAQSSAARHPGITAHRGNSGAFPENTLQAFQSGIDLGVDWVELDIYRTKDGKLVVLHDPATQRVGDKNLIVKQATFKELQTVDIATDFRRRMGKTLSECPPQRIPLLEEALALMLRQKRTRLSIQPKADCVAEAVALVKKMGAEHLVGFNDGNLQYMSTVKELAPRIPVFWDRGPKTDIDADIRIARSKGFEALVINYAGITEEKVQKIKSAGMEPGAWTVNDIQTMKRLRNMGVERIYTDRPKLLISLDEAP
jgi:glycerophosphoryl diester phosphodiesterase